MEPQNTVRDITWNPLSWWNGFNPVYSREEVAEINESLKERAPTPSAASPVIPEIEVPTVVIPEIEVPTMYGGGGGPAFSKGELVKRGTYENLGNTKQDGKDVNIIHRGQQAVLNGKPVIADGSGKWLDASDPSLMMSDRPEVGKYSNQTKSKPVTKIKYPTREELLAEQQRRRAKDPNLADGAWDKYSKENPPTPTPDPTPVSVPTPEIASTSSSPDSQIPRMTFEDANKGLSDGITIQNPFADVYKSINFDASNSAPDAGDSVSGYSNNNGGFVVNPGEKSNDINDPSTWTDSYKLRRAFLDADDSLQGLRNVEALKGIKYAEGKHYRANEQAGNEGQSDFVPIDKSDYKKYKRGDLDAGSFVSELSPWSQQLVENLSTGKFGNPDSLKDFDISKYNSEVPYSFDDVPTETFRKTDLNLKYPGIFNSTYRPVI